MTRLGKKARYLVALMVATLASLFLVFVFFATQNALDVWQRLQAGPPALLYAYTALIGLFIVATLWLIIRILHSPASSDSVAEVPLDEDEVRARLDQAEKEGVFTEELREELNVLNARKASGRIYVVLFGDVSTGKSSIIKALLPDASVNISVRAGSTREITQYVWNSSAGDELVLSDLPGRNESEGDFEILIEEEARRAQLVIYVCESDLSRSQLDDVQRLLAYNKPLIICVNKSDRLGESDRRKIQQRIVGQLNASADLTLAFVQSGGSEEIVQISADGEEHLRLRERVARVDSLAAAIQAQIDSQSEALNNLRDASVFVLIKQKLDESTRLHRQEQAENIIRSSTKKAVFGALASISPGSDLLIQGVIGTAMVKSLCKLYDIPVKDVDIDQLFDFSQGQIKKSLPIMLAVAGNAMKAFPGVGTITGGVTHAFAYGFIFDALGKAVLKTLQQRGSLKPVPAAIRFGEQLNQNIQSRTGDVARLVFDQLQKK
jgi:predicted GTPase